MNVFRYFEQYIGLATIWDLVDILIVAALLYKLIKFVRNTVALRLLKGHLEKAVADIEIRLADKLSAADRAALEKEQTDLNASLIVVGEQLKTLDELIGE